MSKEMPKVYGGRYEAIEELGTGAFSVVYKARILGKPSLDVNDVFIELNEYRRALDQAKSKYTGELVALKKLKSQNSAHGLNFFASREIKILKEISYHPNIIKLVDVFIDKKTTFLVIECVRLDFDTRIRTSGNDLTEADIKSIVYQILNGLRCLHKDCAIHRDLKPGNILIAEDETIKISDYGSSRYSGSPNREMTARITTRSTRKDVGN